MGVLSNYCGFGGSGIPQHQVDAICAEHDKDYATIQASGKNPYLHFNWADQKMLKALEQHSSKGVREVILKQGATALWKLKQATTSSLSDSPPTGDFKTPDKKRLRGSSDISPPEKMKRFRVEPDGDAMVDDEAPAEESSRGSTLGKSGKGSTRGIHETKIIPQQPHYGVPECVTVTLPHTMYFAAVTGQYNNSGSQDFNFRTNALTDLFPPSLTSNAPSAPFAKGLYPTVVGGGSTWQAPLRNFPATITTGASVSERPHWLRYYARMYQAYTVLKCEWEVTFHNPRTAINGDLIIGHQEESYSSTSSGNVSADATLLVQSEMWPDVKWNMVHSQADSAEDRSWTVVKGTYYPGQANKNVRNDEAAQTWTTYASATAIDLPTLTERIHFKIWKAPFNDVDHCQGVNVRVHLRITAQFRDLNEAYRYPISGLTAITQTVPDDIFSSV